MRANKAIQNADLIIVIGTRFDDRTTENLETYAPEAFKTFQESNGMNGGYHANVNSDKINSVINTHYNYAMDQNYF